MKKKTPTIGFIGQGYIGKNYADVLERAGHTVVRYALEEPHRANKGQISTCDIVFIAVPTPTTPKGFDASIVRGAVTLVGKGKIAVIKSTVLPGTTVSLQKKYPDRVILYSPEFLSEATAAHDAAHPFSSIIGVGGKMARHSRAAKVVHSLLPKAPYTLTCTSTEAELIKYAHNGSGYVQIVFFNLMYDLAHRLGADWKIIGEALAHDRYICSRYANPVHKSGRGAGGNCFIKDFAALASLYGRLARDPLGTAVFKANEKKNQRLLKESRKDRHLLRGVYGRV